MTNQDFCERIFRILSQKLDVSREKLYFLTTFCEDLGAEDLDQADIVEAFEREFGIKIPDVCDDSVKNIGDLAIRLGALAGMTEIEEYVRGIAQEERRVREEQNRKQAEVWNRNSAHYWRVSAVVLIGTAVIGFGTVAIAGKGTWGTACIVPAAALLFWNLQILLRINNKLEAAISTFIVTILVILLFMARSGR